MWAKSFSPKASPGADRAPMCWTKARLETSYLRFTVSGGAWIASVTGGKPASQSLKARRPAGTPVLWGGALQALRI
jgi:hypothetical protein